MFTSLRYIILTPSLFLVLAEDAIKSAIKDYKKKRAAAAAATPVADAAAPAAATA
jgi:predicted nucleic-acid-binding protein